MAWFFLVAVFLAALAGGAVWLRSSADVPAEPSQVRASQSIDPGKVTTVSGLHAKHDRPHNEEPGYATAAQLYVNSNVTLAQRFTALADQAAKGDLAASHLAAQIANECHSVSGLPPGTPPVGRTKATQAETSALEEARKACEEVQSSPEFAKTQALMKDHSIETFDVPIKLAIREQFADRGAAAALDVAVSALRARPDPVTARLVANELSQLDVSVFLDMQGQFQSVVNMNPARRQQVMQDAFALLSCDFGNPCGPNSFAVRRACFGMGICVPGADLQTLYEQEILSGQERRDVLNLLDYLRQVEPTQIDRWQ